MTKAGLPADIPAGTPAAVDKESQRLFVYGSLMEGFFNYKKSLDGKVISRIPGSVQGLLYHQSNKGYPALVSGEGRVRGEFLELKDFRDIILLCDRIEGYIGPGQSGNEYERRISAVSLDDGSQRSAWIYWYARADLGSPGNPVVPVPSGDWRSYMYKLQSAG